MRITRPKAHMHTPRVIINATTCVVGGAIQTATSFILSILAHDSLPFLVPKILVSKQVHQNLPPDVAPKTVPISPSPARLLRGKPSRNQVLSAVARNAADALFTVYGPAYVRPSCPHLMGFADPWVSHAERGSYKNHSLVQHMVTLCRARYKRLQIADTTEIVTETETARLGLLARLRWSPGRIHVIGNCYSRYIDNYMVGKVLRPAFSSPAPFRALILAAAYPHKNFQLAPRVLKAVSELSGHGRWQLVVTLPPDSSAWRDLQSEAARLNVDKFLVNEGVVPQSRVPSLIESVDVVLHPSLLETFSATYLEAMRMGRLLIASDLPFARDVCGQAALYCNPFAPEEIARAMHVLATDRSLAEKMLALGNDRLGHSLSPTSKFNLQVKLISEFVGRHCRREASSAA